MKRGISEERRKYPRAHMCTNVRIHRGGYMLSGSLMNISIGGMLAEAEIGLSPKDDEEVLKPEAEITIDIPKLHLSSLKGKILRVSTAGIGYQIAVKFCELKPEIAHRILERMAKSKR